MIRLVLRVWAMVVLAAGAVAAHAAEWPERPVKLVVPYAAGGNVDIAGRVVGQKLQEQFGQPFVVENRPGAGGLIATDYVASAAPDGYIVAVGVGATVLFTPVIMGRSDYDWTKNFRAVGSINLTPLVLQVHPSLPVQTIKDFLDLAKKKRLNFELGGQGSINHLLSELMQEKTGIQWETVVYKGNSPGITALVAGECDFSFDQVSISVPFIRAGQLHPIAVTARDRMPLLPEVPTFNEQGYGDFSAATFTGLFLPAKTPAAIADRLGAALARALRSPDVLDRFTSLGSETFITSPTEFTAYVNQENQRWLPLIKRANIKGD